MSITSRVSRSPTEESRKRGRSDGEDYISNLPESVTSHILSCLPTKDAVRTCVLSKDWEFKWNTIYNMDIDDRVFFSSRRNNKTTFVDFVDRILLLSQNIKNFQLSCSGTYDLKSRMSAWISALLKRNVESLHIEYFQLGIVLPRNLHNNSSLRKLKLELLCTFRVPLKNCFPNLTSLYLFGVNIHNDLSSTDSLIFTFPVLETFELISCRWLNVKFVEFFAPELTAFKSETPDEVDGYSIKIFGPKLSKFESWGGLPENVILNGSPIVNAIFHYNDTMENLQLLGTSGLQLRKLLKEVSNIKELELTYWVTEAIAQSKQGLALPRYDKLAQLYLEFGTNIEVLLVLLHSAPSLETLIIEMDMLDDDYDYDALESVPSCVSSRLDEVRLHCYNGETRQVDLADFLLNNALKLRKCHVFVDKDIPTNEIMEQLSKIPKASTCLSIVVE